MTKRILIVEDTMGIARPLEKALSLNESEFFHVEVCGSAEQALSIMEKQHLDLIITDLRLPGMNGLEFLEHVHLSPSPPRMLMITAYGNPEVEARVRSLGAAFLPKPFHLREATKTANRLLVDAPRPGFDTPAFEDSSPPLLVVNYERRRATHFKVLASDLDGTLMHGGSITPRTWSVLRQIKLAGLVLILATGRQLDYFLDQGPFNEVFESIVAEDGAVVYFPRRDAISLPFGRIPTSVIHRLEQLKIPLERGMSIVATRVPHDLAVLRVLREFSTGVTIEYNRGAVMLLPPGATKATGLAYALRELGFSPRNLVACGDAENDRSMFEMAELAVAVPNALPQIRALADTVITDEELEPGTGFDKFVTDLINRRQPTYRQRPERRLVLGYSSDGAPVYLDPLMLVDSRLGIFGASSSGKSWLAGMVTEELFKKGYQFCVVDPEGDYRGVASSTHSLSVNVTDSHIPPISELMNFIEWHDANIVVDMSEYDPNKRPTFLEELLYSLRGLRQRRGRPHWLLIDEIQSFCPAEGGELTDLLLASMQEGQGVGVVSYRPTLVAPQLLQTLDHWLLTRLGMPEELDMLLPYLTKFSENHELIHQLPILPTGQAFLCSQAYRPITTNLIGPIRFQPGPRSFPHSRHLHKYLRAALPPQKRFYFCDSNGNPNGRIAANLWEFNEMVKIQSPGTLEYHLKRGDFQKWLIEVLRDEELAHRIQKLEVHGLCGEELKQIMIDIVHNRYEELDNLL